MMVIGILAAVAIPTFLSQRSSAERTTAVNDMRNAATEVSSVGVDHDGSYATADGWDEADLAAERLPVNQWVSLEISADAATFCLLGRHALLPGETLRWDKSTGSVEVGTATLTC